MCNQIPDDVPRNAGIFINRSVRLRTEDGGVKKFPGIVRCERDTGIPIGYPQYERWYLRVPEASQLSSESMRKKAVHICSFLNYILWSTECKSVNEIGFNDIRGFLRYYREKDDGSQRSREDWKRCIRDVYDFLSFYQECNKDILTFGYDASMLIRNENVIDLDNKNTVLKTYSHLGVTPPRKTRKRTPLLAQEYLDMFLLECEKYAPMIVLGVALQAYGGLREGEVVNLTRSSLRLIYGGFGIIDDIIINLQDHAPFAIKNNRKSSFGRINILRDQRIYEDFIPDVLEYYNKHESLLSHHNASEQPDAPLFINKYGRPMSVQTYTATIKEIFIKHFLPNLKKSCLTNGNWAKNAPYIEAYEKEYPGAQMFRDWFTLYLLTKTALTDAEISDLRGDSSPNSLNNFRFKNSEGIRRFKSSGSNSTKRVNENKQDENEHLFDLNNTNILIDGIDFGE